jgi:type VI secretion system protein ImpA
MTAIDLAAMLRPNATEAPSGPPLEYDERYIELEKAARGTEQEEDAAGKVIREKQPPNWSEVERLSLELAKDSKDLRIAVYLARARLALAGLSGLSEALELLKGYIQLYWGDVHPQLDPADGHDPSIRVNALASLCDNAAMLRAVRAVPLTESRQFGRVCYRDYAMATGLLPPSTADGERIPDRSQIEAAFADTPLDHLLAVQQAAVAALQILASVDASLGEKLGAGNGPDFAPLEKLLATIKEMLDREVGKRGNGELRSGPTESAESVRNTSGSAGAAHISTGEVRSRDDVIVLLDKICRYYAAVEPSSPVPLILNRTKRLVTMTFLDILKELTPGGLQEFQAIAGLKQEEEEESGE